MQLIDRILAAPGGAFFLLAIAALLEVTGDSFFQAGVHRLSGLPKGAAFAIGTAILFLYGVFVNLPNWDFGKLLGVYIVFFFVIAQVIARFRFQQQITPPLLVGGCMIVAGGFVITFWKV